MRFGVVMEDEQSLRERLPAGHGDELRRLLDDSRAVQLRVRVLYENDAGLREIVAEDREIAQLREEVRGKPEDATYYDRIVLGEPDLAGTRTQAGRRRRDRHEAARVVVRRPRGGARGPRADGAERQRVG